MIRRDRSSMAPGVVLLTAVVACMAVTLGLGAQTDQSLAEVRLAPGGVEFAPIVEHATIVLKISGPAGFCYQAEAGAGESQFLSLFDASGEVLPDGAYNYELSARPAELRRRAVLDGTHGLANGLVSGQNIQSGAFTIRGGVLVDSGLQESDLQDGPIGGSGGNRLSTKDVLHYDDVIITGSLCVGFDCVNGESFGYDTLKLKENNLRIYFEDTSVGSFPSGDWRIRTNDTTSGGASYFAVEDGSNSRTPFRIETGAPSHSLYVEDYGRVRLGTSVPVVELHIVDGDTPTVRLDQDGSSGWTAQSWDLAGNETNFFIRDVTNGSKLPFRVQPNSPSNTLTLKSDGKVGIGTWTPGAKLHLSEVGTVRYRLENSGAGTQWDANKDANGDFSISLVGSGGSELEIEQSGEIGNCGNPDHDFVISVGPGCTATPRSWIDAGDTSFSISSSRAVKQNVELVRVPGIVKRIQGIPVYRYDFVGGPEDRMGLMAEDFHRVFGRGSGTELSGHEMQLALWLAVQELAERTDQLRVRDRQVEELLARVEALESGKTAAATEH